MTDVDESSEMPDPDALQEPPDQQPSRAHSKTVWALIIVATLILTLSSVNTWVDRQVLDTDAWVDTSAALLDNDDLRHELSVFLVNQLYSSVDVGEAVGERLPENLEGLASPVAAILRDPLVDAIDLVLQSEAVREVWESANRAAHSTVIAILEDDLPPALSTAGGAVTIDLGALVRQVGAELGLSGDRLDQLPDDAGVVTIVQSDTLEAAQTAVQAIQLMSVLLFLVVVVLYGVAIYLARNWRREATRNVGVAVAFSGFLLLVIVRLGTEWIADTAESATGRTVSSAVLPIATDLLSRTAWAILTLGALIWLFAELIGPSRFAAPIQRATAAGFRRHAAAMWIAIAVLILLVLAWGPISGPDNLWGIVFVIVLVVAGVEALRRTSLARAETEQEGSDADTGTLTAGASTS